MEFTDKRVLVTGGAQGLGRAIVQKFHDCGATVVALDKDLVALNQLKSELPNVTTIQVDLLDWNATQLEVEKAGPFNHLVNNAGVFSSAPLMSIIESDVDFIFGVNFKAGLNVAQIFAKGVVAAGIQGATIVNISSMADRICEAGVIVYCCSKAAVTMMTKCMAKELGPHGIRVNCVCPTGMRTNLFGQIMENPALEKMLESTVAAAPIPRLLETSETAGLVLFLSSPLAAMITGEDVAIDGGLQVR